jgi:monoamine oxidase
MIDVAIVGAGLTGLALAERLQALGQVVQVFEARDRIGGRILSDAPADGVAPGATIDLGASWYWPDTEPRITALIESLGLRSLAQPDEGQILSLPDASEGPKALDIPSIHGGARRLHGGMGALMAALHGKLKPGTVVLDRQLKGLRDAGDHIELQLDGVQVGHVQARRVVLTLPPRLIAQDVSFAPPLPATTLDALNAVPTWMAREAKAALRFDKPFWVEQGHSGSALVSHPQAVLREIWDASDGQGAALAGFSAFWPDSRGQFAVSMPLLVSSQLGQLFGPEGQSDRFIWQDWSSQKLTCSELDRTDMEGGQPQADPVLRRPHWSGRLFFGGTETARQAAGHMEGALESAARLADFLRPARHQTKQPGQHLSDSLQTFEQWVLTERQGALGRYQQHLNHWLSRQDADRVTQRAVLATVEQTYSRALELLAELDVSTIDLASGGRSELTPTVLGAFSGFSKALVESALDFNARSCALSNFAHEHHPDGDYLRAITADLAAAWREFAWATNDLLCARSLAMSS